MDWQVAQWPHLSSFFIILKTFVFTLEGILPNSCIPFVCVTSFLAFRVSLSMGFFVLKYFLSDTYSFECRQADIFC